MDLSTIYMGLKLKNPLMAAACPLGKDLDTAKSLEDHLISGIVLPSLFEEELIMDQHGLEEYFQSTSSISAEAIDYFPDFDSFDNLEGEEYLESISKLKQSLDIPIIASLNGHTPGGWVKFAKKIEQAGADALELNIYYIPTDENVSGAQVEEEYCKIVGEVRKSVELPLALKVAPFFSSFSHLAKRFDDLGVNGLVLFNRFLEPDFELDLLDVQPKLELSSRAEMRLPLHWLAILYGKVSASLAATRGIKDAEHVLKMLLAGADVTMMASLFYQAGFRRVPKILARMKDWMEEKEYSSVEQLKGSMSYRKVADPSVFERANYIKMLKSFKFPGQDKGCGS